MKEQHPGVPETIQSKTPEELLALPLKKDQIRERAHAVAHVLIDDPVLIPHFLRITEEARLAADQGENQEALGLIMPFLDGIRRVVREYDWSQKQTTELTHEQSRSILIQIPYSQSRRKKTAQQEIVQGIARGYINDRFERNSDWRGSLISLNSFLSSAAMENPDIEAMGTWFDVLADLHPSILKRGDISWRAPFVGIRCPDPKEERYLALAYDISRNLGVIARLTGKTEDLKRHSKYFNIINLQVGLISAVFLERLDPTKGPGIKAYVENIRNAKDKSNQEMQRLLKTRMDLKPGELNALDTMPLSPDLIELAQATARYPTYAQIISNRLQSGYENLQHDGIFLGDRETLRLGQEKEFPYRAFFGKSKLYSRLVDLFGPEGKRAFLKESLQEELKERGGEWTSHKFSLRKLRGYVVVREDISNLSPGEKVKWIDALLKANDIEAQVEEINLDSLIIPVVTISTEEVGFVITSSDFMTGTPLSSYFDLRVPDEIRDGSIDRLRRNLALARDIPGRFRRMPTQDGDQYTLLSHPDLPRTIKKAVLRKGMGLEFDLELEEDSTVFEGKAPHLKGTIDFEHGRANIHFGEDVLALTKDYEWLLTSVLLRLVEKSCCPALAEVEEERRKIETEGVSNRSIPGYIGHVGGFRSGGERKQFTPRAEVNFAQAVSCLYGETKGVSLAEINKRHGESHSQDTRYLTYYSGRDTKEDREPISKENPQVLI